MEDTSKLAYGQIKPSLKAIREQVLDFIKSKGEEGCILEEIEAAPQFRNYVRSSINARPSELEKRGLVKIRGTRVNSRNRKMKVWVAA